MIIDKVNFCQTLATLISTQRIFGCFKIYSIIVFFKSIDKDVSTKTILLIRTSECTKNDES